MVIACAALAVSLGGTGYAAIRLPANSVGTVQLKPNSITSAKVRNYALRRADFRPGTLLRGPRGATGVPGVPGPIGPAGPQGPPGTPAGSSAITVRTAVVTVPGNAAGNGAYATRSVQVNCNADERAVSGGTNWENDGNDLELWTVYQHPVLTGSKVTGWKARGGSDIATNARLTVYALCEKVPT